MVLFGLTDRHERDIYVHFKLGVKIRQIRHHSSPNFESRNFPEFSNPNPNPWSTSGERISRSAGTKNLILWGQ